MDDETYLKNLCKSVQIEPNKGKREKNKKACYKTFRAIRKRNEDTKMISMTSFWCLQCYFSIDFTHWCFDC